MGPAARENAMKTAGMRRTTSERGAVFNPVRAFFSNPAKELRPGYD